SGISDERRIDAGGWVGFGREPRGRRSYNRNIAICSAAVRSRAPTTTKHHRRSARQSTDEEPDGLPHFRTFPGAARRRADARRARLLARRGPNGEAAGGSSGKRRRDVRRRLLL